MMRPTDNQNIRQAAARSHPRRVRALRCCVAVVALTCASLASAEPPKLAGQKVAAVLDRLRTQGLTFIYNTDVIPPQLTVQAEPRAQKGLQLAREVLTAHQLTVTEVVPGVFAVVKSEAPKHAPSVPDELPVLPAAPLAEVVVNTSRYTFAATATSYNFLTQDQLQSMPRLIDEPLRAVQRLPGVANNGISSLGQIRGGETNETAIVLDGLRLYEPFHLKNFLSPVSLLDSRLIDGIEVYAGGFPATYGGRMSAVIEATTVRPPRARYYEAGLSLFHTSGLAATEFAEGRGQALLSVRRSNAGLLAKASESDFGTPNYSDAAIKLDYQIDQATRGSLQALVSNDRISARRDSGAQRARAEYRNAYTWATLNHDWSQNASSRLIASFTEVTNQRIGSIDSPGRRAGQLDDDREFHIAGLQLDSSLDAGRFDHRFGAAVQYLTGHYDYSSTNTFAAGFPFPDSAPLQMQRSSVLSPNGYEASGYWDVRAKLGDELTLETGLRFDRETYGAADDSGQFSPRFSLLYNWSTNTRLRASWGRFSQAQGINELQVEDGVSTFHRSQHADHMILSFDHDFPGGMQLRIEGYRKDYRRVSPRFENLFDVLVLLPELEFDRVRLDPSSARSEGIEVLLKIAPIGSWSGWLSYARSRVTDRIDNRDVRRSWDQRDAVSAGVSWSSGPWSVSVTHTYHTGWPTTGLDVINAEAGPQVTLGRRNAQKFGDFSSLDFRATRTFALSRGVLDVFIEATNALSQGNPCCVEYDVSRSGAGNLDIDRKIDNWLPLVPSAGVLWRY